MASEPNWGKWGTIAAWGFGVPMLCLAVLSYLRPPDPNHPMKFDFLMRTVSIPLWLALSIIVALAIITALMARKVSPGNPELKAKLVETGQLLKAERKMGEGYRLHLQQHRREITKRDDRIGVLERDLISSEQFKKQISELRSQNDTLRSQLLAAKNEPIKQSTLFNGDGLPSEKLPGFDPSVDRVVLTWTEELEIRIWRYSDRDKGLLLDLANLRTTWIGNFTVEIMDATSWDKIHSQFRESRYFKPLRLANGKELGPGSHTSGQWFLRTKEGKIVLGNSQEPVLQWPPEDSSATHVWRLDLRLCIDNQHDPGKNLHVLKPLPPAILLISWDTSTDVVSMVQQH
jgi:hypothetical protein